MSAYYGYLLPRPGNPCSTQSSNCVFLTRKLDYPSMIPSQTLRPIIFWVLYQHLIHLPSSTLQTFLHIVPRPSIAILLSLVWAYRPALAIPASPFNRMHAEEGLGSVGHPMPGELHPAGLGIGLPTWMTRPGGGKADAVASSARAGTSHRSRLLPFFSLGTSSMTASRCLTATRS